MKNSQSRIISVASGKGGVGKTSFSLNLAYSLTNLKKKVCIIDADLGLANIDVILGINPKFTLEDAIFKNKPIEEILIPITDYLDLLPGSSGIPALANLNSEQRRNFIKGFSSLKGYDFIIIDNSSGIVPSVLSFCLATKELIVVLTPEPTSITDAYALIKSLKENGLNFPPFLVLNKARDKEQIKLIMNRMQQACKKFLNISVLFLGVVFEDKIIQKELSLNVPISKLYPNSVPGRCYQIITQRLLNRPKQEIFLSEVKDVIEKSVVQFASRVSGSYKKGPISLLNVIQDIERVTSQIENVPEIKDKQVLLKLRNRLVKLTEKIDRCIKDGKKKAKLGVLSLDIYMKNLIKDILNDKYMIVDVLNEQNLNLKELDLVIYNHLPEKPIPDILEKLSFNDIPVLLISSFNYSFPKKKNIKGLLKSPFKLQELYTEIEKILHLVS